MREICKDVSEASCSNDAAKEPHADFGLVEYLSGW